MFATPNRNPYHRENTMATQTATQTKTDSFDRKELTRTINRIKHEVGGLVDDANRRSPYYARSKEEATAKRDAALKVLTEFAERIDTLKKENN